MKVDEFYQGVYIVKASRFELRVIKRYLQDFKDSCMEISPLKEDDVESKLLNDLKEI